MSKATLCAYFSLSAMIFLVSSFFSFFIFF